ncbi:MAG: SagB/ThcOx family dehydrogenase, partial [Acidobacteria bacterium]|nr:SagB/ThcOx family dehydrogenase [Acidobacteriota bacterium]
GGREPSAATIGTILRYSLGLSAWKQFHDSRWSLRVNPSSGNLHPTEAYLCSASLSGERSASVYHYAPDRHVLEQRCAFDADAWTRATGKSGVAALIALTSIHWRESWKYGERAFRYCQHDLGHAIAAIRIAASLAGYHAVMLPEWSQKQIAELTGIDRDEDYVDAEREEPGCLIVVSRQSSVTSHESPVSSPQPLLEAVRRGRWAGRANQLSEHHVQWSFIDEVARATEDPGRSVPARQSPNPLPNSPTTHLPNSALLLQRRSAVALDARSSIDAAHFFAMLAATLPSSAAPWDALWWDARIHLALFVHRVDDVDPGLYLLPRNPATVDRLKAAFGREFDWTPVTEALPLVCLARGDCRALSQRVSCNQEIAADGFFSLGMIADFESSLRKFGPSFYRHLFWESGVVGQVLYLQAEAAGTRGTGIGCFFDDPVHDVLGLTGHAFQSLYHFTIGIPVEDTRLTTEPGYQWEEGREVGREEGRAALFLSSFYSPTFLPCNISISTPNCCAIPRATLE